MKSSDLKKFNLPDSPGVYYFLGKGKKILYVGKATSLKDRVKSYLPTGRQALHSILMTRGPLIEKMLSEAVSVDFVETDSVLEALLLEAYEIKRIQPLYNTKEKDDKSHNYVIITKEEYPRVLIERGRNLLKIENSKLKIAKRFGPFPHGSELREALKIVRKLFPFRDKCTPNQGKPCFNAQIGLCPGVCSGDINKKDYRKLIKHLELFFEGKKDKVVKSLEKEMKALAKEEKFEEADKVKKKIFALEHIQDVALIKQDLDPSPKHLTPSFRIEAYDIAHLSGKDVVGVMVVIEDAEFNKSQYRKFKIIEDKNDDTRNLREMLVRRFNHPDWVKPNLIVIDGGLGQINMARKVLKEINLNIDVVSVVKDDKHKAREIMGLKEINLNSNNESKSLERNILLANLEAHRFAINYHRRLRGKGFRI